MAPIPRYASVTQREVAAAVKAVVALRQEPAETAKPTKTRRSVRIRKGNG